MTIIIYMAILILVLPFPFVLFHLYFRTIEKRTKKIIELLPKNIKAQYLDAVVWFKGYDVLKKKKLYDINPSKPLYSFNLADLYLLTDKLIVVPKFKMFGKTNLLSPFAICWLDKIFELTSVIFLTKQINTELVGNDVEIQFEDSEYSNYIKLVVKRIGKELYNEIKS